MRKKEPLDDIIESEKPVILKQSFKLLLDNNVKSSHEIINELNLPIDEIENLCSLPKGTLIQESRVIPLNLKILK